DHAPAASSWTVSNAVALPSSRGTASTTATTPAAGTTATAHTAASDTTTATKTTPMVMTTSCSRTITRGIACVRIRTKSPEATHRRNYKGHHGCANGPAQGLKHSENKNPHCGSRRHWRHQKSKTK